MEKLLGKTALITGASRGIGRAIAIEFAKEGANIVINYSKDELGAEETLKILKGIGVVAYKIKEDVSSFKGAEKIIDFTLKSFGKIDILVNNAAKSTIGLFMDSSKEEIENI